MIGVLLTLLAPAGAGAQKETSTHGAAPPDAAVVHAALARVAPSLVRIHVVSIE